MDAMNGERKLAMFIDFENIARGVKEAQYKQFELKLVLERLLEKGKIIVRRAYADWNRFVEYKRPFHEWAIELIDVPQSRYSGKNSADIRMVVDALDLAYGKTHIDSFALVSGDSDFSPLVSKLRENDRYVIGLGVKSSSSDLLVGNCDVRTSLAPTSSPRCPRIPGGRPDTASHRGAATAAPRCEHAPSSFGALPRVRRRHQGDEVVPDPQERRDLRVVLELVGRVH